MTKRYILLLVMSFQPVGMEMDQSYWRGIRLFVTAAALPIEVKTTRVNETQTTGVEAYFT